MADQHQPNGLRLRKSSSAYEVDTAMKAPVPEKSSRRRWTCCQRSTASSTLLLLVAYMLVSTYKFLAWYDPVPDTILQEHENEHEHDHTVPLPQSVVPEEHSRRHARQHEATQYSHKTGTGTGTGTVSRTSTATTMTTTMTSSPHRTDPSEVALPQQHQQQQQQQRLHRRPFKFDLHSRDQPPFSIFYNLYVPSNQGESGVRNALAIVKEQMDQIGQSHAASYPEKPVRLYYNTIGQQEHQFNHTLMRDTMCNPNHIQCIHMQHYAAAFEEHTLERLSEYCHAQPTAIDQQQQQQQQHRVVYMHNKGSFHSWNGENQRWRRAMTAAVTLRDCLDPPDSKCTVCGLLFFGAWALIMPGNFWAADCAYIQKLPPPGLFFDSMDAVFERRREKLQENPVYSIAFPDVEGIDDHGSGRYSQEHWVGSHPDLMPCDVTAGELSDWRRNDHVIPDEFSWSMFPRPNQTNNPANDWDLPPLIGGNIFKWYTLYNRAPPDDSWAWKWFPYGEKYRQATKLYGNQTFDIMVTKEIQRLEAMFGELIPASKRQASLSKEL